MRRLLAVFLLVSIAAWLTATVQGCDLCGCYTPQLETWPQTDPASPIGLASAANKWSARLYGAVAEQFTHFGTVQIDGEEVDNPSGQYLDSSITQLVGGYTVNRWLAVQANVPVIYRSFKRPEGFAIDHGTESGLGDISLLGKVVLWHIASGGGRTVRFDDPKSPHLETREPDLTFSGVFIGGVKFATGDSSRLKEEFNEIEIEGAPESGIHGHDLTLGSGSYDGIFGGQISLRYKNFFFAEELQFTLRGDGLHQYHFANDLSWSGGPGWYLIRNSHTVVGLQAAISGEYKDLDRFRGAAAEDTGITAIYAGPRVLASLGKWSAEAGIDIPLSIDNTALQAVPDFRITGAIAWRF